MSRMDPAAVAATWFVASARSRATRVVEAGGGVFAVLDPRYPLSFAHNRLVAEHRVDGLRLVGLADEVLGGAGLSHRQVDVVDDVHADDVEAFRRAGYDRHERLVRMTATPARAVTDSRDRPGVEVVEVDEETLAPLIDRLWRQDWLPDADDETIRQLVSRRHVADRAGTVHRLAVMADGAPVASADVVVGQVRVGGGPLGRPTVVRVAEVDGVGVLGDHRGQGLGDALMAAAARVAADAGVAYVVLAAVADDWPRQWYAARGYADAGSMHGFTRR